MLYTYIPERISVTVYLHRLGFVEPKDTSVFYANH